MSESALSVINPTDSAMSIMDLKKQVQLIQQVMKEVMQEGEHYGAIEGCGPKKTLLKPGAEKLCLVFRLDPQFEVTTEKDGDHITVLSKCVLYHGPSGTRLGSGFGSCSTKESKYAWRKAARTCPECGKETIIKGREEYGGGWLCYSKKGGCGAKWEDGADVIESQQTGRVANEDVADQYNTVLKMANKRSLVAAVLVATAASDIFTQDIEDMNPADLQGNHKGTTGAKEPEVVKSGGENARPAAPQGAKPSAAPAPKPNPNPKPNPVPQKAPPENVPGHGDAYEGGGEEGWLSDVKLKLDRCTSQEELNKVIASIDAKGRTKPVMEYYGSCLKAINDKKKAKS